MPDTDHRPRPSQRRPLHAGWTVTNATGGEVSAATVPGCVHTDLLAAGVIADPFVDANELAVAWVADADWSYRVVLPAVAKDRDRTDLVFGGLDTLAEISVDGVEIARTANMHRSYRFDVGHLLARPGDHELAITFRSATRAADALHQREGHWPSSSFGRPFNYLRKMACSWGWDWGPWLTTAGIWRAVELHRWDLARLASVRPAVTISPDDVGTVTVDGAIERAGAQPVTVAVSLADPSGATVAEATTTIDPDHDRFRAELTVARAERWWPAGQGAQPLYTLSVRLVDVDAGAHGDSGADRGATLDEWQRRVGFRSLRLDTAADSTGSAFTFVVNGRPMFARGVNWIPDDPFPSRVTPERYRHRLQQAADANVDLVRVWGGGIYEDDAFYDACDEVGLLVWQDFAFACAAYPEHLLADEVEAEARENVERLMPHPSLALWNGNNENIWGFWDWDWQRSLDGRPWGGGFYFDLLPRVVADVDPDRPYWPGSPYSGSMTVAPNADASGCIHEWDVWNRLDHGRYRDRTPRFVAEFGWQAPPTWSTLSASIGDDPLTPTSPGMIHHQKATDGNDKLERGLAAHFDPPSDMDAWLWATQLNQARAVRTGIEHFRSLRGTCMGTIWWQLNDCWPVTSWALVDGGGRLKPAWYALRDAYAPRLLTIQPRGRELVIVAVNDSDVDWSAVVAVARHTFAGDVVAVDDVALDVAARSVVSWVVPPAVARPTDPATEVLRAAADDGAEAWWWFARDRELRYPDGIVTIEAAVPVDAATLRLEVRAASLVRDLAPLVDRAYPALRVDRQLVSLLPGERTSFTVTGPADHDLGGLLDGAAPAPPHWRCANDLRASSMSACQPDSG